MQKQAAQMEYMKIVFMQMNNRHLKPKPGGYFSLSNAQNVVPGCLLLKPPEELWQGSGNSGEWFKLDRHGSARDTRKPVFV